MMKNAGHDKKEKPFITLYDYLLDMHNGLALLYPQNYHQELEKFLNEFANTDIKPIPLPSRNICLDILCKFVNDIQKARQSLKKN
jgi:hypothetical protein